ncbi:MAG: tetratricopeptide repeat protein [Fermentimonas sp.]|nr:tetratricopeptide repeat protein [Fermentimonas sp.]
MMKKISLLISFFITISTLGLYSQTKSVQDLIQEGVDLHDAGEYEEAIERYNEALELDSTLIDAVYEMSLSYLALKDFENASIYSTQVINSDDETLSTGAYAVKSEALAEMDSVDKAIELLNEGLEKNGDGYLLNFNLAINFFKIGDIDKTLEYVKKAIDLDKSQSGAFLLNAYALNDVGLWVQSILSFQMFLLLEPDSRRSKNAFDEMLQIMRLKKSAEPVERSFIQQQLRRRDSIEQIDDIPPLTNENGLNRSLVYNAITTTLDSLEKATEELEEFTAFKAVNMEMMKVLESESKGPKEGIFWTFYIPFFSRIAHSNYYDTFCRYISVSYFPESFEWWEQNPESAINFVIWFEKGDNI